MGHVAAAARFLVLAASVLVSVTTPSVKAQGSDSYTELLAEVKKWQAENPNECGLDTPSCGIRNMQDKFDSCSAFRIVNGCAVEKPLTIGWQVGLNLGSELCSGTLVSPQHVLLAAHCVERNPMANTIRVFVGATDMRKKDDKTQQILSVSSYAHDPDFDPETVSRDVAIAKLSKPVNLQSGAGGIRVACLPVAGPAPLSATVKGQQCIVAGFGINDFRGRGSGEGIMRYTMLKVQPQAVCKNTYRNQYNHATMFCAVGQRQGLGTDSCDGDSGSSVICKDSTNRWVVTGIVSFGAKNCGQIPGVYADAHKLGLTVPNPRSIANQNCKSISETSPAKPQTSTITPVKPPIGSFTGPKRPGGTSTTIEATKKEHGCQADDQCQTNICRFVALCVQEKSDRSGVLSWFNFFGKRGANITEPPAKLRRSTGYNSVDEEDQETRGLGSHVRRFGQGIGDVISKGASMAMKPVNAATSMAMRPIIKLGGVINMGTFDDIHKRFFNWRLGTSIFGSLFTKRKCELSSICWNREWTVIPTIPVAMFEE